MSADGDTVREAIEFCEAYDLDVTDYLAALARLEAAEAALDALAGEPAMVDRLRKLEAIAARQLEDRRAAEAQRDEWQRAHEATWKRLPKAVQTIYMREYRAALAEAGLE